MFAWHQPKSLGTGQNNEQSFFWSTLFTLAAAVLYFLAVGQVKGFAFTLGLTTLLDVVVVFLVTWPLMYLASGSPTLAKPGVNGLGAVQQVARERRAALAAAAGRE